MQVVDRELYPELVLPEIGAYCQCVHKDVGATAPRGEIKGATDLRMQGHKPLSDVAELRRAALLILARENLVQGVLSDCNTVQHIISNSFVSLYPPYLYLTYVSPFPGAPKTPKTPKNQEIKWE